MVWRLLSLLWTHDATNETCYGDALPGRFTLSHDSTYYGELEFLEHVVIWSVSSGEQSFLSEEALTYNEMKRVLRCPSWLARMHSAMPVTSRQALCVDGALKSEASREAIVCDPCIEQSCRPCTRRGTCQLRETLGCTRNPLSRGLSANPCVLA